VPKSQKYPVIYAFIDSQNLNLGTSKDTYKNRKRIYAGWKLDYQKFRLYLSDKFRVQKAFLFIGFLPSNQKLYQQLNSYGYELVFKPTVKDNQGKPKGNIDAELVLHAAAIQFPHYEQAVIVSGDGDFYCLYEFLEKKQKIKHIIIPNRHSESSLLKRFQKYKILLFREKENLKFRQ
jgi:uncharacterized LabA/DUF88 family protein